MARPIGDSTPNYSDQAKAQAIEIAQRQGITAAAKAAGASKDSITRWLREAGVDPAAVTQATVNQQRQAAQASVAARQAKIEASKERLTGYLVAIAELAATKEIEYLQGKRVKSQTETDKKGSVTTITEFESVRLSEVVGARTRAIHDLQLLLGEATERGEYRPSTEQVMSWRDELADRRAAKQTGTGE